MSEHPIEGLMNTTMNSIKDMIDVNTIIGEPIETSNNVVIIPISKVSFGFAAGGSEFNGETVDEYKKADKEEQIQYRLPFGGGTGAGVTINPIAFLVIQPDNVKLMPVTHTSGLDKLLDYVPDLFDKINEMFCKKSENKSANIENSSKEQPKKSHQSIKENKNIKKNNNNKDIRESQENKDSQGFEMPNDQDDFEYEYDETNENEDY